MAHQLDEAHFWKKVDVRELGACWLWRGKADRDGYGIHRIKKRDHRAHRVAYHFFTGHEPPVVMHTCNNPRCCNPHHLRGGTQQQNIRTRTSRLGGIGER